MNFRSKYILKVVKRDSLKGDSLVLKREQIEKLYSDKIEALERENEFLNKRLIEQELDHKKELGELFEQTEDKALRKRIKMQIFLDTQVIHVDFGKSHNTRIYNNILRENALNNGNIVFIKDLILFTKIELLKINNMGFTSVRELEKVLKKNGLSLGMTKASIKARVAGIL